MNRIARFPKPGASLTLLAVATAALACGCQTKHEAEGRGAEHFLRDDETSAATRTLDRQVAAGAGDDATLRAYHFDRAGLNALGREKVDLILDDAGDEAPFDLYVDVPDADDRRAAVMEYLEGITEPDRVRLMAGPNPDNAFSAAAAMAAKGAARGDTAVGKGLGEGGYGASSDMAPPQD
jgi:hypothetical protein